MDARHDWSLFQHHLDVWFQFDRQTGIERDRALEQVRILEMDDRQQGVALQDAVRARDAAFYQARAHHVALRDQGSDADGLTAELIALKERLERDQVDCQASRERMDRDDELAGFRAASRQAALQDAEHRADAATYGDDGCYDDGEEQPVIPGARGAGQVPTGPAVLPRRRLRRPDRYLYLRLLLGGRRVLQPSFALLRPRVQ